ncbi:protein CURLY FLAG LEAF 1-like isoform X2 [Typha angustifolia]|uniref:protein CURLY FLAG LEAF 1-like isoform X2 n=1 Tax=Typha angustifolia TaxID=59011 RepID=UPI003C2B363B
MTASNIEMITASLQNCSLATSIASSPPPPPPPPFLESSDENGELAVELNSEVWEQCLRMQRGTMYYDIDWDDDDEDDDFTSSNGEEEEDDDDDNDDSSTISYTSSTSEFIGGGDAAAAHVLVLAGCKSCFMYFMVPKHDEACPKCGGGLLHLGRSGCI